MTMTNNFDPPDYYNVKEKRIAEICKEDNRLQRMLLRGEITKEEFRKRTKSLHAEYEKLVNENKQIEELINEYSKA